MAVYKVIQDIEAEDKLLGPLTLKGFIYAIIAGTLAFINFKVLVSGGLGAFRWVLILVFAVPMLLFAVLASPLGREQPTEIWLLSRVRFFLKPRGRIWDQSGINHLVTITVPKKFERHLTKDLSQTEVTSRLEALAKTMDSRGWAVKNVNVNLSHIPGYLEGESGDSDRLIGASSMPQAAPIVDVHAADDILDEQNNPAAQKLEGMMKQKDVERKREVSGKMNVRGGWTMHSKKGQPAYHLSDDSAALKKQFASAKTDFKAQHKSDDKKDAKHKKASPVTEEEQADKLELAQSGNDLSVASISKLANRQPLAKQIGPDEVEISLH